MGSEWSLYIEPADTPEAKHMVRFTQKLSLLWRYSTEARDESTLWIVMNQLFEIIRANKIHVLLTHYAKDHGAVTLHIRHTWPQEAIRLSDQFRGGPGFPRSAKEGAGPDRILTVLESWPLWHLRKSEGPRAECSWVGWSMTSSA